MKRINWRTVCGALLLVVGCALMIGLTGCDPNKTDPALRPDANGQTAAGNALVATGTPWGMLIGTGVNILASFFIAKNQAKGAVDAADKEDWTDDDAAAMARKLEAHGFVMTRKPPG